jgi:hypothetical protein
MISASACISGNRQAGHRAVPVDTDMITFPEMSVHSSFQRKLIPTDISGKLPRCKDRRPTILTPQANSGRAAQRDSIRGFGGFEGFEGFEGAGTGWQAGNLRIHLHVRRSMSSKIHLPVQPLPTIRFLGRGLKVPDELRRSHVVDTTEMLDCCFRGIGR